MAAGNKALRNKKTGLDSPDPTHSTPDFPLPYITMSYVEYLTACAEGNYLHQAKFAATAATN